MANAKNLKPFKKGDDKRRNITGRPKRTHLTDCLREQLAEVSSDERTIAEHIARVLIKKALAGDIAAIKEAFDRSEGRPIQGIDVGNKDDKPLVITFDFNSNARLKNVDE